MAWRVDRHLRRRSRAKMRRTGTGRRPVNLARRRRQRLTCRAAPQAWLRSASAFAEPEAQASEQQRADAELQGVRRMRRREEGFQCAGDGQQRNGTCDKLDGLEAGERERIFAAKHAWEEDARRKPQTGRSGEHDAGEFERAVRGDEAPEAE